MHQPMDDCRKFINQMHAYIDGELDQSHCSEFESHLDNCTDCRIVVNTLEKTIHLVQADGKEIILPADARRRLFTRLGLEYPGNHDGSAN